MIAPTVRETMALKATLLPRLMSDSRQVTTKEMQTAFRGMSQPGRTLLKRQTLSGGVVSFHRSKLN
jgi:hypothetical protein